MFHFVLFSAFGPALVRVLLARRRGLERRLIPLIRLVLICSQRERERVRETETETETERQRDRATERQRDRLYIWVGF